jgi:rhodanese-related sulfurtransferase
MASWFHEQRAGLTERRGALAAGLALGTGALAAWHLGGARPPALPDPADPATSLDAIERALFRATPLPECSSGELASWIGSPGLRLFDLRGADAYAAGHIPGAEPASPFEAPTAFLAAQGAALPGRIAVFADLVGEASTAFLARLRPAFGAQRPLAALRLRGGVMRWWAEGRALGGEGHLLLPDGAWRGFAARLRRADATGARSCPIAWCRSDDRGRAGPPCQAVTADRLTWGVLLTAPMVSSVM